MYTVSIDMEGDKRIIADFESRYSDALRKRLNRRADEAGALIMDSVLYYTPIGPGTDPDNIASSLEVKRLKYGAGEIEIVVWSTFPDPHVQAVEEGRSPGSTPPPKALIENWLEWSGGNPSDAGWVAMHIGEKGSEGHHMFDKGYADALPLVLDLFESVTDGLF